LIARPRRTVVEVTGKDRVSYLHRMLTQDIRGLGPMRAAYACVLTPKGRILGDPVVWNLGERLLLEMDPTAAAAALPHLERYVIADDVSFRDLSADVSRRDLVAERTLDAPPPGGVLREVRDGREVLRLRRDLGTVLRVEEIELGAAPPGAAAPDDGGRIESVRIEEGVPRFGAELDDRVLPNEARLESAISWTKGCYPGQEPVVMAKHRGHPPHLLMRLAVQGEAQPEVGEALLQDGASVGRVTSAAAGCFRAGAWALGYVRHAAAAAGALLDTPSGARLLADFGPV
jgi:folate-binding protein YgfZ